MNSRTSRISDVFLAYNGRLTAIVIAMVLCTSVAQAYHPELDLGVPGSACEAVNGGAGLLVITPLGTATNKSTSNSLQVSCPVIASLHSKAFLEVSVTSKTSENVTCAVIFRNWNSTEAYVSSQTQSGPGHLKFVFDNRVLKVYNSIRCTIPKASTSSPSTRSSVNGYYYIQYD